jgi:hypothetical protein
VKINHPVEGYNGKTTVGPFTLVFEDGTAESDELNKGAKAYLKRRGYGFGSRKGKAPEAEPPQPLDPRKVSTEKVGDPVRDAAVDPREGDFLAPTNAGEANPHGTEVVSPEIHASQGVRPVKPGVVHVDDPAKQDEAEKAHAAAATDGTPVQDVVVPEGDLDAQVSWVGEAETKEERAARASALYRQHEPDDDPATVPVGELADRLRAAVAGESSEPESEVELKGEALDKALEERGLPKTGSADEKRARVAEPDAAAKGQG